jgi:ribosomal protein L7Ae-like RNA K-turn-binding protein
MTLPKCNIPFDSEELIDEAYELFRTLIKVRGKYKKTVDKTDLAVEKDQAKFVYIVSNCRFPEEEIHLIVACQNKGIPYVSVPKNFIGGLDQSVAVLDYGDRCLERLYKRLTKKLTFAHTVLKPLQNMEVL